MIHQWLYLWREALTGLHRSKVSSLTAVLTIGISSAILGVFFILILMAYSAMKWQSGEITLRAYVGTEYESFDALEKIEEAFQGISAVDSIQFISKEEALKEFSREFDNQMMTMLSSNPLPPSFILWPGDAHRLGTPLKELGETVKAVPGVEAVSGIEAYQDVLDRWKKPLFWIGLGLVGFLGAAVSLIISNAVKLNLLARKELVDSMKYCGAGPLIIIAPFLFEGLLLGGAGSLLGIGASYVFVSWVSFFIPGYVLPNFSLFALAMLFFSGLLAGGSSFFTVLKFIKEK